MVTLCNYTSEKKINNKKYYSSNESYHPIRKRKKCGNTNLQVAKEVAVKCKLRKVKFEIRNTL